MKKIFLTAFFCAMALFLHSQAPQPPRLIVRGDDMGSFHAANDACLRSSVEGIQQTIEVMVVCPWFPEMLKMLRENPGIDIGLHMTITSEWDDMKWRPLTHSPGLTDDNGFFLPQIRPHKDYPGLSVMESDWTMEEIEREFRAQIELCLKNIPQTTHISGHMGATAFDPRVAELTRKLAKEYNLADVSTNPSGDYGITGISYAGPHATYEEKEASFVKMLERLEPGRTYMFLDHPGYDSDEMRGAFFAGYDNVAQDRQGVTDLFTSEKISNIIKEKGIELVSYNQVTKALERSTPEAEGVDPRGLEKYFEAVKKSGQDLHSLMIIRHGKVVAEKWFGDNAPGTNHVLHSVSKTFTSTAVGFAVTEGRLKLSDKVISFFAGELPAEVSPRLAALEVRHLLTMTVGHDVDPTGDIRTQEGSWEKLFLAMPLDHNPGEKFVYNSMATYMLSSIIQKVSGQKLIDYLYPRLFRPLGIGAIEWEESPAGVNTGGWGLHVKAEDMAKLGLFYLQKGMWNGEQLLPASWIEEASSAKLKQAPVWVEKGMKARNSDWIQGYGYQIWMNRVAGYRADGANGQFIIVLPAKDAVIVTTANISDMQGEIDLIWKYLYPAIK